MKICALEELKEVMACFPNSFIQGQRVYVTEVVAESFQLLEKRDNTVNHTSKEDQMPPNFSGPIMDIDDDGLPF